MFNVKFISIYFSACVVRRNVAVNCNRFLICLNSFCLYFKRRIFCVTCFIFMQWNKCCCCCCYCSCVPPWPIALNRSIAVSLSLTSSNVGFVYHSCMLLCQYKPCYTFHENLSYTGHRKERQGTTTNIYAHLIVFKTRTPSLPETQNRRLTKAQTLTLASHPNFSL